MTPVKIFEEIFQNIPLGLLEIWGGFAYIVGILLVVIAYGSFTFHTGDKWRFGRERHAWDDKAVLSMGITFCLIWLCGYIGSFFVLVPAAQTFETFKDIAVFSCIVLFGYPALLVIPFAYGLSDFYEGIPPEFILDWWAGYFINPACFWVASQLIGKCPDFKKRITWFKYFIFVSIFMTIEPVLWGYICSDTFSLKTAYYVITPAIFFTTLITWCLAPLAMLVLFPLAKRFGVFWADIEGHVQQRGIREAYWSWESGRAASQYKPCKPDVGFPLRLFFLAPIVAIILVVMGATAYFTLKQTDAASHRYVEILHKEISNNINTSIHDHLNRVNRSISNQDLGYFLEEISNSKLAEVFIINRFGERVAISGDSLDLPIVSTAISELKQNIYYLKNETQFRISQFSARNMSKETWLIHAMPSKNNPDWIIMTAMSESSLLGGFRKSQGNSALIMSFALLLALLIVAALASMIISPIRKICKSAFILAQGDLSQRAPFCRLAEINSLSESFNDMAVKLQNNFNDLNIEEKRLELAVRTGAMGVWEWNLKNNDVFWNEMMFAHFGYIQRKEFKIFNIWSKNILKEDYPRVLDELLSCLKTNREFDCEFKVRWPDNSIRILSAHAKTLRDEQHSLIKMVGICYDITEQRRTEKELMLYRHQLEDVVAHRTSDLMTKSAELQKLVEKQAKAEVHEKIAQIFLSMRDYTNSPLQIQTLSIALLKKRCPNQINIIKNLEASVDRLANINRILSRLETTFGETELLDEQEILEYLDKFENLH